jgi:hypothetical protein
VVFKTWGFSLDEFQWAVGMERMQWQLIVSWEPYPHLLGGTKAKKSCVETADRRTFQMLNSGNGLENKRQKSPNVP